MVLIPIDSLNEGMVVAKSINNPYSQSTEQLLKKGTTITAGHIRRLREHEITTVYIERAGTGDIKEENIIDEHFKAVALEKMRNTFDALVDSSKDFTMQEVNEFVQVADTFVDIITSKPNMMVNLMNIKNHHDSTYTHLLAVCTVSVAIGTDMGLSPEQLHILSCAALLHDLGKLKIPEEILDKPGKLTDQEYEIIKHHPEIGVEIIANNRSFVSPEILAGMGSHHEKMDGTGYPKGLKGDEIHLFARIIAVADVFDALTSHRAYRTPITPNEAMEYILGCADTHFDMEVVNHFVKKTAAFPVGCFVELSDGRTAIVVENFPENCMRPKIRVKSDDGATYKDINLLEDPSTYSLTIKGVSENTSI